ncbi:YncE family protein [Sphingomonas sp. NFR15]|uniref:YncE family protein n=1 Tax=Sphingomonas sp. NFR15 TaxID=1566282 RepID=UPI0008804050|nr:PQQ-binding-like beta-propeller repeat protein [Sphingomonas sp. NFR15]SDA22302.1 40-residue YVTN family beta-propeller repeat-containing protein [Sphingomonas sp. NFR15]
MRLPLIALFAAAAHVLAAPATPPSYAVVGKIAGPDGAWDYARVGPDTHRLFVARGGSVTVIDLAGGGVTSWGDIARAHAVVPLPGNRLLVTSGNDATVRFLDTTTGKQIASVAVGKKADAAIFDPAHARAFVMNADGGTVSVIDTTAMRVTATFTVKPALEYAALVGGALFINNEDANELEMVDVASGKLGRPIAMPGCEGPTGLAYDEKSGRLISACANGKAVIVDAKARRFVRMVDIGKGADAVILDAARRLAFVPCGKDGVLDILSLDAPGGVVRVGRVTTEVGARTGALDPATGAIYLPTARFAAPATSGARPIAVPGTFHVLVVKPA